MKFIAKNKILKMQKIKLKYLKFYLTIFIDFMREISKFLFGIRFESLPIKGVVSAI